MDQTAPSLFPFDNSYQRLPERFYARQEPSRVRAPELLHLNHGLAAELGLDAARLATAEGLGVLAGNRVPMGAEPIAMVYAAHQFGNWVPQLGDGRAILLGEVIDNNGQRRDIQLKGAGRTPFSRSGDGRAAIGPVLREYLLSEAMHVLKVPTTRALAAIATGERVQREQALPGAVLTRVAASHIRVGTFQYFAGHEDVLALHMLADHVIERHYPKAEQADNPYVGLLLAVIERQAQLVAKWLNLGFIHGVMNTDNCAISGETIDYGPCAFMDHYHPGTVFSSIDMMGRYAYSNQSRIAHWNLLQLANCLLPLIAKTEQQALSEAEAALQTYPRLFADSWLDGMRRKLGLRLAFEGDKQLADDLLNLMQAAEADFTNSFRALCAAAENDDDRLLSAFDDSDALQAWLARWRTRLAQETRDLAEIAADMRRVNPVYIARNHLVADALAAAEAGDMSPFQQLHQTLANPFERQSGRDAFTLPPEPHQIVHQTFCGT